MTPRPWFRLYREVLSDRKIARLCKTTGQPKAMIIGFWTTLLCLASGSDCPGALLLSEDIPLTVEDLADESGLDPATVQTLLEQMHALQMLSRAADGTWIITHWEERQFDSDFSSPRVQRYRRGKTPKASETGSDETPDETLPITDSAQSVTLQESDTPKSVTLQESDTSKSVTLQNQNQNQIQNQKQNQRQKQTTTESDTQHNRAKTEQNAVAVAVDQCVESVMSSDSSFEHGDKATTGAWMASWVAEGGEEGGEDRATRVRGRMREVALRRDVNHQQACAQLVALGVDPAMAERLAREHPPERIQGWCAYARRQSGLTNPAGFVVNRLAHGLSPPAETGAAKRWYSDEEYARFFVHAGEGVSAP